MSLAYFPLYPADFEADTSHLTLVEDGAYNRLLRLCWMTPGCSLPDDETWIFRRMRARDDAEKEAIRTVLNEFFKREKARVFNPRLSDISRETEIKSKVARENGKKGGRPRKSLKDKETEEPKPSILLTQKKANQNQNQRDTDTNVSDAASVLFSRGVDFLKDRGTPEPQARSVIGRWRKEQKLAMGSQEAGDARVIEAFTAAKQADALHPIEYITKTLSPVGTTDADWDFDLEALPR